MTRVAAPSVLSFSRRGSDADGGFFIRSQGFVKQRACIFVLEPRRNGCFLLTWSCEKQNSEVGSCACDSSECLGIATRRCKQEGRSMDRCLVLVKLSRSNALFGCKRLLLPVGENSGSLPPRTAASDERFSARRSSQPHRSRDLRLVPVRTLAFQNGPGCSSRARACCGTGRKGGRSSDCASPVKDTRRSFDQ